jgi:hypothetical protein
MNNKVVIKYDILGTGENEAIFTFDEATEERNMEKFLEALILVSGRIAECTANFRKLQLNNMELSGNAKVIIRQEAGEDKFNVEIKESKNNE